MASHAQPAQADRSIRRIHKSETRLDPAGRYMRRTGPPRERGGTCALHIEELVNAHTTNSAWTRTTLTVRGGSSWRDADSRSIRQHELGGGQRLWFVIDIDQHRVVLTPHTAHPKETE